MSASVSPGEPIDEEPVDPGDALPLRFADRVLDLGEGLASS